MVSGIDYEFELAKQVIKTVKLEDINNFFLKFYQPDDRVILIKGPEKYKDLITKEMFLNYESEIAKTKTLKADFALANKKLINKKLRGSKIVKEIKYSNLDITELHLANGVKVFLKPTKFKEKEFSFNARSPGGFSHIPLPKLYSAQNAQRIVNDSGLGSFTRNEINDLYNPNFISIETSFSEEREGLYGRTITAYQKELFELIYLHFEEINYNPITVEKLKFELKESLKLVAADPKRRFSVKFAETYFKNHPRIKSLTDKDIDQINIDDVKSFYRERFKDGSDFTFTFVGDFKIDEFKGLIEKYLGSLPNITRKEKYVDDGVRAERELVKFEVYENLEDQSTHYKAYVNGFKNNVKNRFKVYITQNLMKRMLHEEIREKQNLVYSISVQDYGITKIPEEKYTLIINFDCDPKNKDKIFAEIDKVLEKIKKGDFPQNYLDDAIKGLVTSYLINRESNRWLVGAISGYYEDKEPLQMINAIDVIVKSINKNDIKRFANETFKDKFIQASLMPKK
jgi:zinc protease